MKTLELRDRVASLTLRGALFPKGDSHARSLTNHVGFALLQPSVRSSILFLHSLAILRSILVRLIPVKRYLCPSCRRTK